MTIEANLASIAKSLETIAAAMSQRSVTTVAPVAAPAVPVAAPTPVVTVPNVQPAPSITPPVTPSVSFDAPVQASPSSVFADHNAFVSFIMDTYKTLGPIKGAKIQDVLASVGVKNINDVRAEMYATVKAGVEALVV